MQIIFMGTNLLAILGLALAVTIGVILCIYLGLYLLARHEKDIEMLNNLRSSRYLIRHFGFYCIVVILAFSLGYCLYYYIIPPDIFRVVQ